MTQPTAPPVRPRIVRLRVLPTVVDFLPPPVPLQPPPRTWQPVVLQRPVPARLVIARPAGEDDDLQYGYSDRYNARSGGRVVFEEEEADAPVSHWTPSRIVIAAIVIVTLIAFVATSFSGLFMPGEPPPAPPPLPQSLV